MQKQKTILIMGTDEHAQAVRTELEGRGQKVAIFNSSDDWHIGGFDDELTFSHNNVTLSTESINSLYWRWHGGFKSDLFEVKVNNESILNSWLKFIDNSGVPCYNGYYGWDLHRTKPYQMIKARRYLLNWQTLVAVPRTIWGRAVSGKVAKGVQGGFHAFIAGHNSVDAMLCSQDRLHGETIRAFVFKDSPTIAYRVSSSELDYRSDQDCGIDLRPINSELEALLKKLIYVLRLRWAGIDIIYDGSVYWILDINPSPMFLGFQRDGEILDTLCKELSDDCSRRPARQ